MIIVSWDVGVVHLAYCILQYENDNNIKILDWDIINLIEDECSSLQCIGQIKDNKEVTCGKKATYCLNVDSKLIGFCKTHLSQHKLFWSVDKIKNQFEKISDKRLCSHLKKDDTQCNKPSSYLNTINNSYLCTAHFKSSLKNKLKECSPYPIRRMIVKKYPTSKLQLILINKLDRLSKHFAELKVNEIIIENQPSYKNPKMKSISNTLFDYFLIKGYNDKFNNMDIRLVRFMCPNNKLKVNNDNTLEIFKSSDSKQKYKLTKELSIQYTKQLLSNDPIALEHLDMYKKKDDMCDAYLQGMYYLKFVKNKKKHQSHSTKSNSKSNKKIKKIRTITL